MAKELSVLKQQAEAIKTEVNKGANTSSRIGGMFSDMLDYNEEKRTELLNDNEFIKYFINSNNLCPLNKKYYRTDGKLYDATDSWYASELVPINMLDSSVDTYTINKAHYITNGNAPAIIFFDANKKVISFKYGDNTGEQREAVTFTKSDIGNSSFFAINSYSSDTEIDGLTVSIVRKVAKNTEEIEDLQRNSVIGILELMDTTSSYLCSLSNKYYSKTGVLNTPSGGNWYASELIHVILLDSSVDTYTINKSHYITNSEIPAIIFFDANKKVISFKYGDNTGEQREAVTFTKSDIGNSSFFAINSYSSDTEIDGLTVSIGRKVAKNTEEIEDLQRNINYIDLKYIANLIDNSISAGDSVTAGHIVDEPNHNGVVPKYSYPTQLAKLTGWNITNAGVSGITAQNWWKNEFSKYNYTDYQLATMEFGYNGGLSDTLDTDVNPFEDYNDYLDTNTGCYCKIIEKMRELNKNIFIVLIVSPRFSSTVINKIAEKYGLPVIDLTEKSPINLVDDIKYHGKRSDGEYDYIHFNKIGYNTKAYVIYKKLLKILIDNESSFNYVVE